MRYGLNFFNIFCYIININDIINSFTYFFSYFTNNIFNLFS